MRILTFLISFLTSLLGGIIYSDTNTFHATYYSEKCEKLKKNLRIVVLADLHGKDYGNHNRELIRKVRSLKPDLIIVAGDLITAKIRLVTEPAMELVRALSKDYPVYYGMGNHESYLNCPANEFPMSYEELLWRLKLEGATILDNGSLYLPEYNLNLYGLSLERSFYKKHFPFHLLEKNNSKVHLDAKMVEDRIGTCGEDTMNVLIAHDPEYFPAYASWGADLTLSGHLHGGVMNLPGIGGIISPRFQLFPQYAGGKYEHITKGRKKRKMIVSRGLGTHTIPLRIFNPGEIVVVDLMTDSHKK